ncbi:MAG TPA: hypothetical protein VL181_08125 [Holophagaceae bacterium]|nr:hypothetical protein [Holophagaceae bacterium]
MRIPSLATPSALILLAVCGCARKGDPVPVPSAPPKAPVAVWASLRRLDITLPSQDVKGDALRGLDAVRILYLPLGLARPTAQDVFARGEVVFERQRPGLQDPGGTMTLDLKSLQKPAGWIVAVVVRAGQVPSGPSDVLPWMDPAIQ